MKPILVVDKEDFLRWRCYCTEFQKDIVELVQETLSEGYVVDMKLLWENTNWIPLSLVESGLENYDLTGVDTIYIENFDVEWL